MFWNSLPRHLRDPSHTDAVFGRLLKTFLFSENECTQCIGGTCDNAPHKLMFYLLTFLSPNQQCQSTEGTSPQITLHHTIHSRHKPLQTASHVTLTASRWRSVITWRSTSIGRSPWSTSNIFSSWYCTPSNASLNVFGILWWQTSSKNNICHLTMQNCDH